jgi:hypothetical protein
VNFLQGLYGAVAIALLAGMPFAEEGVPLPFAPSELTLQTAGRLIAAGGLDHYVAIPVALAWRIHQPILDERHAGPAGTAAGSSPRMKGDDPA